MIFLIFLFIYGIEANKCGPNQVEVINLCIDGIFLCICVFCRELIKTLKLIMFQYNIIGKEIVPLVKILPVLEIPFA